jgi:hypothetical protein
MKINGRTVHKSVTIKRVVDLVETQFSSLSNPGICIACGEDQEGCEPDAEKYTCESCNDSTVYGAEQLLIYMA